LARKVLFRVENPNFWPSGGKQMRTAVGVLLLLTGQGAAFAQGVGTIGLGTPLPREPGVLRVYSVGADATYYSVGLPYGSGALPAGVPEQPAFGTGGRVSLGWSDVRDNSEAVVSYAGSYATQTGYAATRALSQSLFLDWQRKVTGRWDLKLVARGGIATRDEFLFTSISLGSVASPRITFDDLAAAALGNDGSSGVASGGGGGLADSGNGASEPLVEALFGSRVLTTELTAGLTWHESERLAWTFTLFGERMESLPGAGPSGEPPPLAPISTAVSSDVQLRYLWSPRTTFRVDLSETRTVSRIEDMYATRAVVSIARTLSERWLADVYAGGSQISLLRSIYPLPVNFGYVAGGSLAFQTSGHTLIGSMSRELGDSFGLGAVNSITSRALWIWRRPGTGWLVQAIFAFQKLSEGSRVQDWSTTGAITRIINPHLAAQIAYVYLQLSETPLVGTLPDQSSVRVSVTWYPGVPLYP
jgi:hypothetical protein